ncbi:MAG: hypothetical protein ACXAC7_01740 [Candidatus Hodarchaeales archaeon]
MPYSSAKSENEGGYFKDLMYLINSSFFILFLFLLEDNTSSEIEVMI